MFASRCARVLTPPNRAGGVTVGLFLVRLYFGNLLHSVAYDIELNSGPPKQVFQADAVGERQSREQGGSEYVGEHLDYQLRKRRRGK